MQVFFRFLPERSEQKALKDMNLLPDVVWNIMIIRKSIQMKHSLFSGKFCVLLFEIKICYDSNRRAVLYDRYKTSWFFHTKHRTPFFILYS